MNLQKRQKLLEGLAKRPSHQDEKLNTTKIHGKIISEKPDWLWHELLSAMSTMGNSRGYAGLIANESVYGSVSYSYLSQLDTFEYIEDTLLIAFITAKVRRPKSKARWLISNWKFITECGGLETIQSFILNSRGREIKIKLMKMFDGIGEKYARNMFMEMYHTDFINSIAIDERILDISGELEIDSTKLKYSEHENIFISIANDANISPWELDRLLYFFKSYYLEIIKKIT